MSMVEILKEKLKQIFAKTATLFSTGVFDDFLTEVEARPTDFVDDVAYRFPAYLRLKNTAADVVQTAHFEWLVHSRGSLDFGEARRDPGFLSVSPSLELFLLSEAAPHLQMTPGVYAIFKHQNQIEVMAIRPRHVQALEVLQEGDRKYRRQQLAEWLAAETNNDLAQWQMTLTDLIRWGIIQDNV